MANKHLIMVVEHNQITQDIVRVDLETIGYKVLPIVTTEKAWTLLEEGINPDVMVLGLYFPGEDGPAFYQRLKGDPRFQTIPVLPLGEQSEPEPRGPHGIVINLWRETIDKTPPHLMASIKQALKQKTGRWSGFKKIAKLLFGG